MQPIVTDRVVLSLSLSVCHSSEPCKNNQTDWDAVLVQTRVGPRNHVLPCVSEKHPTFDLLWSWYTRSDYDNFWQKCY